MKKLLALALALVMLLGILPMATAASHPFTDVADGAWYAEAVEIVYGKGYMNGTTATTFSPKQKITRAEVTQLIYNLAGKPDVMDAATFTDLTANWYKDAVAWAEGEGLIGGDGSGCFYPTNHITRQDTFTLLWRFLGKPAAAEGFSLEAKDFSDTAAISRYAYDAIAYFVSVGALSGTGSGLLNPRAEITRAEVAMLLSNFMDAGLVHWVNGSDIFSDKTLAEEDEVVIYYTNDVHTYIDKDLSYDAIADLKAQTEAVAGGVILVDAGDHVQGTAYGAMDKGETIIKLMNEAGYDVATLGNHEFDYGMERALELTEEADFNYVSANFHHIENGAVGANVLPSYQIFTVGGMKIALLGITTPETYTKSTPKYFMDEEGNYIYGIAGGDDGAELYAAVQDAIDEAAADGAEYIIALGHLGDDPASKPWTSEELIANTTGLDAFIDGHSHSTVEGKDVADKEGNTVLLTQTGEYFDAIGKMTITADGISTELITEWNYSDNVVASIKDGWMAEVDGMLNEKIGTTEVDFKIKDDTGRLIRKQETNLGDFCADALYYLFSVTEGLDVDVAIMNGGGIRADHPAGDITYKTCKTVHTFGNVACLQTVTGQQILDALEWGAKGVGTGEDGGFLQVSGLTYEIHSYIESTVQKSEVDGSWAGGPTGEYRVKNVKILQDGEYVDLDLDAKYNLAGYNYTLRDLGDGFTMFDGAVNVKDYVMEDYLVLANYVKSFPDATIKGDNSPLGANYGDIYGEGRISIVTEKPVDPNAPIVIYYTNDVHTYIDNDLSYDVIADLKTHTEADAAGVLLVDAGDHAQGTAYGAMDKGETIIELMNAAGYDLATLGNHEFDYGMERALEFTEMADFNYVSANFYHMEDGVVGDSVLPAYQIFEVNDKKIAFVGITTPETYTKSTPKYFMDENGNYIYGIAGGDDGAELYAAVQKAIDEAAAEGADYIIALGHLGDDPASKPWTSEELIANTTGLDAFIDGHSHSTVEGKDVEDADGNTVLLTQTGEYFKAIGKMSITPEGISTELITEWAGSDEDVAAIKTAWMEEVDTLLNEKIGTTEVDFKISDDAGRLIRKQETNLGDFCADALYYLFSVTEGLDVDVAIMNGGGIRANHDAGDITYKTCKTVHTFGNVACLQTVTGQQILDALEWGAKDVGVGESGGFLQVSGLTYEIHSYIESTVQKSDVDGSWAGGPTGEYRVKNVKILQDGEYVDLDLDAKYNLAGHNYTLRDLGDGFTMFDGAVNVKDYVMEDYLVLANYVKSFPDATIKGDNSPLGADYSDIYGEGRIVIVSEEPSDGILRVPSTEREGAKIPTYVTTPADYDESGSYPLVVMIHGHGGNHNEWGGYDVISNALAEKGIIAVTLDFSGCGASTESFQLNTMTNMKNDVLDVLNYMADNYAVDTDKVGAFGYSMGGRIVLEMIAEEMYDFAAIELVAPGEDTTDLKDLFGGAEAWETMKADANESGYVEFTTIYGQKQELSKEWFADLEKYSDGLVELAAPKYTGESLVIWGTQDVAVRPHVSEAVAETLGSAILNTYDAGGHSYSFYGTDEYTVAVVNNGSVNFLCEELLGTETRINGYVSTVSSYGNLGLTIPESALTEAGIAYGDTVVVTVNGDEYELPYHDAYSDVAEGEALLIGNSGALSLAINMGDFATTNSYATKTENDWYYTDTTVLPLVVTIEASESTVEPAEPTYVLATSASDITDGDKIIIYNAHNALALSSTIVSNYYKGGEAVTIADGKIVNPAATVVWTVAADGTGFNLVNSSGNKLSMGTSYNSIPYDDVNDTWTFETASTANSFYVKNVGRGNCLEYYNNNFTTYSYGSNNEAAFAMLIYVLEAGE